MEFSAGVNCPLCRSRQVSEFAQAHDRDYLACAQCALIFMAAEHRLPADAELAHYRTHRNDAYDPGYRAFLSRLADPLIERLTPGTEGLDYGSGAARPLEIMLGEQGFRIVSFDPFFHPSHELLGRSYQFITCTETIEHFHDPGGEFTRLNSMLRPGGWLGVMTEVLQPDQDLSSWWYPRDPTHVCFYRPQTLAWIADHYGWLAEHPHPNVALFHKG